jgi:hypothetical protein
MRRRTPKQRPCSQAGLRELRAALDAGDALAVVAALKARPKCPTIDGRQTFAMLVSVGPVQIQNVAGLAPFTARVALGYRGLGPHCPSCLAVAELLHEHPALAGDSAQSRAIVDALDARAETWR